MNKERKVVWMCGACGRTAEKRMDFLDGSCYLNARLVYEDSIKRGSESTYAEPVTDEDLGETLKLKGEDREIAMYYKR